MDRQVIEQKIESLRHCLARVKQKTPATAAELGHDPDAQDVSPSISHARFNSAWISERT
jgi:hypothetical protein